MKLAIYAIIDIVSDSIIGTILPMHKHPAAAVRQFIDLLKDPNTQVGQHPEDHQLVCLGYINDEHNVEGDLELQKTGNQGIAHEIILTGKAWLSTVQAEPKLVKEG